MPKSKSKPTSADLLHIVQSLHPLAVHVSKIKLDPANARMGHDLQGIAASLEKFGQRTPIVVNKSEKNIVLKGNGTYQAMVDILQKQWIAAVYVEDDPKQADSYSLADNRLTDLSFFDPDTVVKTLLESSEEIPGMGTLAEMLRAIEDDKLTPDDLKAGEEMLELDKVALIFEIDQELYDAYARLHTQLGARLDDEQVFEQMVRGMLNQ